MSIEGEKGVTIMSLEGVSINILYGRRGDNYEFRW